MAVRERVEAFLEAERAQLPPWAVVGVGTGTGLAIDALLSIAHSVGNAKGAVATMAAMPG